METTENHFVHQVLHAAEELDVVHVEVAKKCDAAFSQIIINYRTNCSHLVYDENIISFFYYCYDPPL
jgi:hypothetical protein